MPSGTAAPGPNPGEAGNGRDRGRRPAGPGSPSPRPAGTGRRADTVPGGCAASQWHLPLDHPLRPDLRHRTHPLPGLARRGDGQQRVTALGFPASRWWGGAVMAGPGDEITARTAGRGPFRASRADREQAIEVLKTAFVEDRLTKEELDARVGQALASRTHADLAAVTSDLHAWRAAARPTAAGPPSTPARTLAKAARRSGVCVLAAFAMVGVVALTHAEHLAAFLAFCSVVVAIMAASGFLGYGVVDAWQERRARGPLPPQQTGRDGRGLAGGRPGSTGRDPAPPGARADQTRADLRTHKPGRDRRHPSGRGPLAPGGTQPVPRAV